jgi:hypothetical protein
VYKWLDTNEELAHRKIINFTNKAQERNLGMWAEKERHG